MIRIGQGFDAHRFAQNQKLILGGVHIPFELGIEGHSDGDVLLHAICDAYLGALGLGDIGQHFPGTKEWENMDSRVFVRKVIDQIRTHGWRVSNVDATIIAEKPRLSEYRETMRNIIALDSQIDITQVSVKASTTDKMGFIGKGEGIAVIAVALLESIS